MMNIHVIHEDIIMMNIHEDILMMNIHEDIIMMNIHEDILMMNIHEDIIMMNIHEDILMMNIHEDIIMMNIYEDSIHTRNRHSLYLFGRSCSDLIHNFVIFYNYLMLVPAPMPCLMVQLVNNLANEVAC